MMSRLFLMYVGVLITIGFKIGLYLIGQYFNLIVQYVKKINYQYLNYIVSKLILTYKLIWEGVPVLINGTSLNCLDS